MHVPSLKARVGVTLVSLLAVLWVVALLGVLFPAQASAQLNRILPGQLTGSTTAGQVIVAAASGLPAWSSTLAIAGTGAATTPAYTFTGAATLGMWRSTNVLNFSGTNIDVYPFGNTASAWRFASSGVLTNTSPIAFASLPSSADGSVVYCNDCTVATAATCPATQSSCICAGSGGGAFARRIASTWYCTF